MRDLILFSARMAPYVVALFLGIFGTQALLDSALFAAVNPQKKESVSFLIEKGADFEKISEQLHKEGLANNAFSVSILARLKKIKGPVVAGEYKLSPSMTPSELLKAILDGKIVYYDFTLPEGTRLNEIPGMIERTGLVQATAFSAAMRDRSVMDKLGVSAPTLEGYLLPGVYKFTKPITPVDMLVRMRTDGQKQITDKMIERTIDLGFTFHQILTIASIIEKQGSVGREKATISSIIHNRLKIGMPLQNDPTLRYGLSKYSGELTQQDLRSDTPYNTYVNTGLPPTPICNPSIKSIEAALFPADTDFLYLVSRGDGTHEFSSSLREHTKAVAKYRALNPAEINPPQAKKAK